MQTASAYMKYIDLDFKPNPEEFLLARYHVKKAVNTRLPDLAFLGAIAAESSTGTWIDVTTAHRSVVPVSGIVYRYQESIALCEIAYPVALFEPGNVSQLLTVVAGNAFGLADVAALKLQDIRIPTVMLQAYQGPALGLKGIYATLGINPNRPIVGSIIKPKCGLTAEDHAQVCYEAWIGQADDDGCDGVDMVKDDEALTSQASFGSDFDRRIKLVLENCKRAEDLTGNKKVYVPNITHSNAFESLRRAEYVKQHGGVACMIDYVMSGCSILQTIRSQNFGLIIHGHRTLFAALQRPDDFGIDYLVWAKLFRIIGGDQVHTGTPALGVMQANTSAVQEICNLVREPKYFSRSNFPQDFAHCRAVAPICGAGLDPLTTEPLTKSLGKKTVIFAGGGCHGHPQGTKSGAAALKESVNAVANDTPLHEWVQERGKIYLDVAFDFFNKFDKQSPNDKAKENM